MRRIKRGVEAFGNGWGVLWRNGQLLLLLTFAIIATGGALGAMLAVARGGAEGNLAISIPVGSVIAVFAILGVWCYAAAFRAVADVLDTGTASIVSALRATFGRIHAVALWGIVIALVHGVLSGSATIGFPHTLGARALLGLVWDTAALLVLPALILDPVGRGRVHRAFQVSSRGLVESFVVLVGLYLVSGVFTLGLMPARTAHIAIVVAFAIGALVLITWETAARVVAYRSMLTASPEVHEVSVPT